MHLPPSYSRNSPAAVDAVGTAAVAATATSAIAATCCAAQRPAAVTECPPLSLIPGPAAAAHLLHDLLLLDQESADDALLHHSMGQAAAIDAVHGLVLLAETLVADLGGPPCGQLQGNEGWPESAAACWGCMAASSGAAYLLEQS